MAASFPLSLMMPVLLSFQTPLGVVQEAVEVALDAGYRHFDCAYFYQNETAVGAAFQKKLGEGKLMRDEFFVVSKLWNSFHAPQDVKPAFLKSLTMLKLDYLDLYLMHSPMDQGPQGFPNGADTTSGHSTSLFPCQAMEKLVEEGLVKSIGVSNFNVSQLQRLLSLCRIKPAVNQVELHPYLTQPKLMDYCKSKGIVLTAYSPFGCPALPWPEPLLENPTVNAIAQKHGKTSAQVLIRFHIQRGIATIPKSATPSRIVENAQVMGLLGTLFLPLPLRPFPPLAALISPELAEQLCSTYCWKLRPKLSDTKQNVSG
uniref:NADP-dependent oxidoreductase domain-containing protein n=1 Tax=Pelusios castaneus TaxID=367368 RepID=A0A8C8RT76_9SAUR